MFLEKIFLFPYLYYAREKNFGFSCISEKNDYLCKKLTASGCKRSEIQKRTEKKEKGILPPAARSDAARRPIRRRPPLNLAAGAVI